MSRISRNIRAVSLAMLSCSLVWSQAPAAPASVVPIEQEPAHRLAWQNEYVRVFEVSLPPGNETAWHEHLHDGTSVRLADATIEDQPRDGTHEVSHLHRGEVTYGATPTARTHRVRNVGETTFHIVYIELLAPSGLGTQPASAVADPRVVLENDRMRALRRILAPGESTDMHTHGSRGVGVPVTSGRLEISGPTGASRTIDLKAGTAQWIEPGTTHQLKNVGGVPIEIVDIELK